MSDLAQELDSDALRRTCDPGTLGFASTEEVAPTDGIIGQARAAEAISFGLEAEGGGFNIFATGPIATGKRTALEGQLRRYARDRPPSVDWVYLHNFRDPRRPIAVELATGRAPDLAADMRRFLEDARRELTGAFESETYGRRRREVTEPIEHQQEAALAELREEGIKRGIAIELTPAGAVTVPLHDGQPMTPADFGSLSPAVREEYQHALEELEPLMQSFLTRARAFQRDARDRLRALDRDVGTFAVGHLVDELKDRYSGAPKLARWLSAVIEDVTENLEQFHALGQAPAAQLPAPLAAAMGGGGGPEQVLSRYAVNVFVTHEVADGAPVVVEMNPTYPNLFGRIEHQGVLGGSFVTDHRMLRAGAVHRANGGYLMLPAAEVFAQPLVWLKLKEILRTQAMRLENPADQFALIPTTTLTPEAIPLDLKVVLVGRAPLYDMAYLLDEDVRKLFRVKAEFDSRVPWDEHGIAAFAGFLSAQARTGGLRHFDAGAVGRVVEHGARLATARDWLSTQFGEIAGLAAEANHWAGRAGSELVLARHVERAIEQRVARSNLIEQRLGEMVSEGTLMIDVEGAAVGQVNGLSVIDVGDYAFGHPVRISATAGPGRGSLLSIERETELSGKVHDKGFLTLSGYLRAQYGADRRIALTATLSFDQSYERIDGDSAASAELYALLSALAGVALRQGIAVTGSVNQRGKLQAIGGVNEKIEGFHRVCSITGLTGEQGVLIPTANERHLMLGHDVVRSAEAGRFHVWSAADVDAGIELLTGMPAGVRGRDGEFPSGTVHGLISERLRHWESLAQESNRREPE